MFYNWTFYSVGSSGKISSKKSSTQIQMQVQIFWRFMPTTHEMPSETVTSAFIYMSELFGSPTHLLFSVGALWSNSLFKLQYNKQIKTRTQEYGRKNKEPTK